MICAGSVWIGTGEPLVQTTRLAIYQRALERLKEGELVYPCTCNAPPMWNRAAQRAARRDGAADLSGHLFASPRRGCGFVDGAILLAVFALPQSFPEFVDRFSWPGRSGSAGNWRRLRGLEDDGDAGLSARSRRR